MTVSSTTIKTQANGNGVTTAFSFPYYFLASADLVVTTTDVATGVETTKTLTTDYTVTGALASSGGTVTFVTAPAVGTRVTIKNIVPLTQATDYTESSAFPAESTEQALDKVTLAIQNIKESVDRTVQLMATSTVSGPIFMGDPVASNLIGWNNAGTALENKGALAGDASSLAYIDVSNATPSTAPSATNTDSLAIGNASISSGLRAITIGYALASGTDSFALQTGDNVTYGATGTNSIAIGKGALVSAVRGVNIGGNFNEVTTGTDNASIGGTTNTVEGGDAANIGGSANLVDGSSAVNIGGTLNESSGNSTASIGGTNNILTGTRSVTIGGSGNEVNATGAVALGGSGLLASNTNAIVVGGTTGVASGSSAVVISGSSCTASGTRAVAMGGVSNLASGTDSLATGQATTASGTGSSAFGIYSVASRQGECALSSGRFTANGDAQNMTLMMRNITTNNTPTLMYIDGASATLRPVFPTDTTWAFEVLLVARRTDADNESAAYKFTGCADNNAGTSALVGSVTKTVIAEDTAAWDADVSIGDAADVLNITVTGEAAKTIRWVAKVDIVQVTG